MGTGNRKVVNRNRNGATVFDEVYLRPQGNKTALLNDQLDSSRSLQQALKPDAQPAGVEFISPKIKNSRTRIDAD